MNERVSNACRTTIGLFVGGAAGYFGSDLLLFIPFIAHNLNLFEIVLVAFAFAICGCVLGIALALGRSTHISLRKAVQSFGLGFLIAGIVYFLVGVYLEGHRINRVVGWAQLLLIVAVAGGLSAAFTRSRLFSVVNSIVSVAVGFTTTIFISFTFGLFFPQYLIVAAPIFYALFGAITGALLKLQKNQATTRYQDVLQPQS